MGRKIDSLLFLQKAATVYEENSDFFRKNQNLPEANFLLSSMYLASNTHKNLFDKHLMKSYGENFEVKIEIFQAYIWQLLSKFLGELGKSHESSYAWKEYSKLAQRLSRFLVLGDQWEAHEMNYPASVKKSPETSQ